MQGVLSYKTKSPFKYRGVTVQVKGGNREYFEGQFRVAKTFFDNRFGVKITGSYMKAKDWQSDYIYGRQGANPMIQQKIMGQMLQDPSYADFNNYYKNVEPNAAPFNKVMMPGYSEEDLFNGEIDNMKVSGALYYRFSKDMQAKYVYRYSTGTSLYMGNNRAPLDNFYQQLHMLEFQGKGFTFHAVRSNDDTRNTYTLVGAGVNLGFASLGSVDGAFLPAYVNEIQTLSNNFTTALTEEQINQAINAGSVAAQNSWLEPGTEDFNTAYDKIKENPPPAGAHYQSRTTLYHLDGMYEHSFNKIDFNVGASFRNTNPVSNGSVYADTLVDGKWKKINVSEFGGFAQGIWHAVENKLKVFGSVRLDKSSNYDLQISPRLALVFNLNEYQVVRLTGQSAFRSPAVTDQYQYLNRGRDIVVGNIDGFGNCYTQSSIDSYYKNEKDSTLLVSTVVNAVKPEQLKSIEFGYNGTFFDKLYVEFSTYYSRYSDFIAYQYVGRPGTGTAGEQSGTDAMRNNNYQKYSVATNVEQDVDTYGASIGFAYYFNEKIMAYVNYTYSNIDSAGIGKDVIPGFNTPKHKVNMGIQANKVYKNLGFAVNWKWVDEYYWEAVFASGPVPAYNSLDLQLNYSFPKLYSIFRIGGSNILGTEYIQAYAMPQIGAFYYASWTFNVDFKK
jgi:outer membrane receptor protein involved in Fe transport